MRVFLTIACAATLAISSTTAQRHKRVRPRPAAPVSAPAAEPVEAPAEPTLGCRTAQPGDRIDDFVIRLASPTQPNAVVSFRLSRPEDQPFDAAKDTPTLVLAGTAEPFPDDPLRYTMHLTVPAEVSNGRYYGAGLLFISHANGEGSLHDDVEFAPTGLELHSLCVEVQHSPYTVPPA